MVGLDAVLRFIIFLYGFYLLEKESGVIFIFFNIECVIMKIIKNMIFFNRYQVLNYNIIQNELKIDNNIKSII